MHSQEWADELSWFAIYLIPDRTTRFYRKWSELVGYDVWEERTLPPSPVLKQYRGDAHAYGCHITVLDAMAV